MSRNLVRHSPLALQRYMEDMLLSVEMLAKLSKYSPNTISKALDQEEVLTLLQLEELAKFLHVPTVYLTTADFFFNREVPEYIEYRNQADIQNSYSEKALIAEFCSVRNDYISIMNSLEQEIMPFNLKLTGDNAEADAKLIIDYFGFDHHRKTQKNSDDYYNAWREIIAQKDIVIIDKSREKIGSDGMCLYYHEAPIIVIFSSDQSPSRKLFTLIHEIVHLGLGESAIDGRLTISDNATEKYCDRVAGYVVAPQEIIDNNYNDHLDLNENIIAIRKRTKASKTAIAIQLKILGYINQQQLDEYLEQIKKPDGFFGGIKTEHNILKYFGYGFVEKVMSAMWHNQISSNTAKSILGINAKTPANAFSELQDKVF